MTRIKIKDLEFLVDNLNIITGNNTKPFNRSNGNCIASIGTYYIDGAYGGHKLVQIATEGGGVKEITYGFDTKKDLHDKITNYLKGIQLGKEIA